MGWSLKFTLLTSSALVGAMCFATSLGLASPNFTALMIVGLCIAISLASDNPLPIDNPSAAEKEEEKEDNDAPKTKKKGNSNNNKSSSSSNKKQQRK